MKKIIKYLLLLFAVLLWSSCEKEEEAFVEIDSVSALGDEFFYNQKVKVWTVVKTNNLADARYTWSCNGGTITQPQGLDENTWQAPKEPGVYTVTCKVDINGVTQTRSREMYVSVYYFDKLERTFLNTLGSANSSMSIILDSATQISHVEATVNVSSATRGFVQRAFGDPDLHVPFSTMAQLGWITKPAPAKNTFPLKDIKIGSAVAENTFYYEWTLNRDPDRVDNLYITNVIFEWYPVGKSSGLPKDGLGNPYNGVLKFIVRDFTTSALTGYAVPVNTASLLFAANQLKNVSMSIDADYVFHVSIAGAEIFSTDAIKQWRIANNSQDGIYINEWRINYVSNVSNSTNAPPIIFIDNAIGVNDGTVLK
jgi:hypothetical protein